MSQKEARIAVRVTEQLKSRLAAAGEKTGVDEADLIRWCIEALLDYVEENGEITLPLIVKPKSAENRPQLPSEPYPPHREEHMIMEDSPSGSSKKPRAIYRNNPKRP